MIQHPARLSWGFAVTSTGVLVIRNWYLLLGSLAVACYGLFLFCSLVGISRDQGATVFALLSLYSLWSFYLEFLGVRISNGTLSYPVRLGSGNGIIPLFHKSVSMKHVLQASSLRKMGGIRVAYLSGEFGQAKVVFDTKGGRDRLFAVLTTKFPHIKIYRWG
jgi:hypothetical protein